MKFQPSHGVVQVFPQTNRSTEKKYMCVWYLSWFQRKFWKINKSTENLIIYILTLNAHKHVKVKKYDTIESYETVETENETFNKSTRNLLLYCPSVASKWVNFWKSTDQQRKTLIYLIFERISEKIFGKSTIQQRILWWTILNSKNLNSTNLKDYGIHKAFLCRKMFM